MTYEAVIGLEVHCQLSTATKLFSSAPTTWGAPPNTQVAPIDMGAPGALPVLNQRAVELAVRAGLALGCTVHERSVFARKNYFYPDLPKGYQITQQAHPLCTGGFLRVERPVGDPFTLAIERVHMEEDAGKSMHGEELGTLIDLNRAGIPLIEIVTAPELRSPEDAADAMRALHELLVHVGVTGGNMERGELRCDANISVRPLGQERFGTRVELKNINSFRFVRDALSAEFARHEELLERGLAVERATRGWDADTQRTFAMRSKEEDEDYRYHPEPDLPALVVTRAERDAIEQELPELPHVVRARLRDALGATQKQAHAIARHPALTRYVFGACEVWRGEPKAVLDWVLNEVLGWVEDASEVAHLKVGPVRLVEVLELVEDEIVSARGARQLLATMLEDERAAIEIVDERSWRQISAPGELAPIVRECVEAHPEQAEALRAGKTKLIGFFLGRVMAATEGRAHPERARRLIMECVQETE